MLMQVTLVKLSGHMSTYMKDMEVGTCLEEEGSGWTGGRREKEAGEYSKIC